MDSKTKGVVIPTHDKCSERKMYLLHKRTQREIEKAVIKQLRDGTSTVFLMLSIHLKRHQRFFSLARSGSVFMKSFF